jgi:hypothetical protein
MVKEWHMKRLAALIAAAIFVVGCAGKGGMMEESTPPAPADFATAVKQAEDEIAKAAKMGHEWRDSKKILKQAKAAHKKGDMDKAMKLAVKARDQGILGQRQAQDQKGAGPWLF